MILGLKVHFLIRAEVKPIIKVSQNGFIFCDMKLQLISCMLTKKHLSTMFKTGVIDKIVLSRLKNVEFFDSVPSLLRDVDFLNNGCLHRLSARHGVGQ